MKIRNMLMAAVATSGLAAVAVHAYAADPEGMKAALQEENQRNASHSNTVEHPYHPTRYMADETSQPRERRGRGRHLVYIATPGGNQGGMVPETGHGIVVLDADHKYAFLKRIDWDVPASQEPGPEVSGIAASVPTNMLYVSIRGHLDAYDLATDKVVWSNPFGGSNQAKNHHGGAAECCERPWVLPDGKTLVVGANYNDWWYVVDGTNGKELGRINAPLSPISHNMAVTPDGKTAFLGSLTPTVTIADVPSRKVIGSITFSDAVRPLVINHDGSLIYVNLNNLLGFEIGDTKTGKMIRRVEAPAETWKAKWADPNFHYFGHSSPSHGIALTPDESEIWCVDNVNLGMMVFDNTGKWPVLDPKKSFKTTGSADWITMTLDGKLALLSDGEVIDIKSHTAVATEHDEYGRVMGSEKQLYLTLNDGHLVDAVNQFAEGIPEAVQARLAGGGKQASN